MSTKYLDQTGMNYLVNQLKLMININGTNHRVTGFTKMTASGISGVYLHYHDDNNVDAGIFLPDGVGFNTGSQAITAQFANYYTKTEIDAMLVDGDSEAY